MEYDPWSEWPDEFSVPYTTSYVEGAGTNGRYYGTISPYYSYDPIRVMMVRTRGSDS